MHLAKLILPLGPTGLVIGLLVGILTDEVLYATLVVRAALALGRGKPFRWFPGLPILSLAEMGLLVAIDGRHSETVFERYRLMKEWLAEGPGQLRNRRFQAQTARIWTGLHQTAGQLSIEYLLGMLAQGTSPERRHEFFDLLVRCASLDREGTDLEDMGILYRCAQGLDLPVLAFHQSMTSCRCLNRDACLVLGVSPMAGRDEILAAGRALISPDSQAPENLVRREAFRSLEDQLDAMERTAERYRQATLKERH
jgi:hypothetical protein